MANVVHLSQPNSYSTGGNIHKVKKKTKFVGGNIYQELVSIYLYDIEKLTLFYRNNISVYIDKICQMNQHTAGQVVNLRPRAPHGQPDIDFNVHSQWVRVTVDIRVILLMP